MLYQRNVITADTADEKIVIVTVNPSRMHGSIVLYVGSNAYVRRSYVRRSPWSFSLQPIHVSLKDGFKAKRRANSDPMTDSYSQIDYNTVSSNGYLNPIVEYKCEGVKRPDHE